VASKITKQAVHVKDISTNPATKANPFISRSN